MGQTPHKTTPVEAVRAAQQHVVALLRLQLLRRRRRLRAGRCLRDRLRLHQRHLTLQRARDQLAEVAQQAHAVLVKRAGRRVGEAQRAHAVARARHERRAGVEAHAKRAHGGVVAEARVRQRVVHDHHAVPLAGHGPSAHGEAPGEVALLCVCCVLVCCVRVQTGMRA
jgi:hypothetical protein